MLEAAHDTKSRTAAHGSSQRLSRAARTDSAAWRGLLRVFERVHSRAGSSGVAACQRRRQRSRRRPCCSASLPASLVTSVRREIGSEHFLNRRFSSPETILARERVNRRRGAQTQRRERRSERGCGLFGLTTCAAVAPELQADAASAALAKCRA